VIRIPDLITVVVPNLNAGDLLRAQLAALSGQDYAGATEIIVADNGSRDGSFEIARAWARRQPEARVITASTPRGPGAARNAGARIARGDFLAFCDADDLVSTSWLRLLVEAGGAADVVGGAFEGRKLNSTPVAASYHLLDPSQPHLDFLPAAAGGNLGVWADVFGALGGFDDRSRTGEDVDFVWRAQLRGYRYQASRALVHKRFPSDLRDAARRFYAYGQGDAWLYRRYGPAGMPRRSRQETLELWRQLARGFPGLPKTVRRRRWAVTVALSCGRLVGSARRGALFP
jgi:glycosyltransferase involved in cell wall biosynthesis